MEQIKDSTSFFSESAMNVLEDTKPFKTRVLNSDIYPIQPGREESRYHTQVPKSHKKTIFESQNSKRFLLKF